MKKLVVYTPALAERILSEKSYTISLRDFVNVWTDAQQNAYMDKVVAQHQEAGYEIDDERRVPLIWSKKAQP